MSAVTNITATYRSGVRTGRMSKYYQPSVAPVTVIVPTRAQSTALAQREQPTPPGMRPSTARAVIAHFRRLLTWYRAHGLDQRKAKATIKRNEAHDASRTGERVDPLRLACLDLACKPARTAQPRTVARLTRSRRR